jgi:ankyrin repeat protein
MMGGGKDYSLEVLNRAAAQGNVELFRHLVHRGADPSRSLAPHRASEYKNAIELEAMIDCLLDRYNFDMEADNRDFLKTGPRPHLGTPLHVAIYNKNIDDVRHLLKKGADPESGVRIATGSNIIIREGWLPALDALLDAGANVDHAFNQAVKFAKVEAANLCLNRGTVPPSVVQEARPNPISLGSHAVFVEERAKMEAFLQSIIKSVQ